MIKKVYASFDVVTAAKIRIKNIFDTAPSVTLSVSGGKDSICLNDLIFKMCQNGEIDAKKLTVDFIDEEAIYPCVEKIVKKMRLQWMTLGVTFRWWCIEVRHFNCFNMLTNDESFICWDRYKQDVWIRSRPPFAITDHPLLNKRVDTYQMFLPRLNAGSVQIIGTRATESIQRMRNISAQKMKDRLFPIYDWTDKDVWRYILENDLEIPDAYIYMYQVGVPANRMRISQFFSVDTAQSLVKMCEFYPDLFNKICKREPNAYMAMLYFDTELFRRQKKNKQAQDDENIDYKAKVLELINSTDYFTTPSQKDTQKVFSKLLVEYATIIEKKHYKAIYNALIGGDPKRRSFRAILNDIFRDLSQKEKY